MIEYVLTMSEGREVRFAVDVERPARALPVVQDAPFWTALAYHRCPTCPLPADAPACPPALDLVEVIDRFAEVLSIETARVRVVTKERIVEKTTDTQTALQSLVGLIMASSQCPILGRLKPLARTHLPFSTVEETITRTASAFLLREYFRYKDGEQPDLDLDGLRALYAELQDVNIAFSDRIRAAAKRDASLNAVALLFSIAALVSASLEDDLKKVRPLYA